VSSSSDTKIENPHPIEMHSAHRGKDQPYVLLIHPLYGDETKHRIFQPGIEIPISLAYLSAYLEQKGICNDILDLRIENDAAQALQERIRVKKPMAVGITASTANIQNAAETAGQVKAIDSQISTIIGGWHASALPKETLINYPQFDYLIHGEGEVALANLTTRLAEGGSVEQTKSLAFRINGSVQVNPREELIADLDSIPFPAMHKVPITRYHPSPGTRNYLRLPSTGIAVGRGCPYRCLFCYKGVWGTTVRFRSPENVLREIEGYIDRFGIRDFRFYDDAITFPKWGLKRFCEAVIDRKLDISWNCWSRVNDVDEDKLRLMKEAGCYHIKFGIEFGTEKALKLAQKGANLDQARTAVALCKKVGIECKGSFIFGIPGETEEDCRKTLDFALEIAPDFATFYPFDPIPGSPFYHKIRQGEIDPERDMIPRSVAERFADQAYKAFYLNRRFILGRLKSLWLNPKRECLMLVNGIYMLALYWLKQLFGFLKWPPRRKKQGKAEVDKVRNLSEHAHRQTLGEVTRRIVDIAVSLMVLILTLPLMVVIALIIKFDNSGPCIFKQTRIGKDRRGNERPADAAENKFWQNRRKKDLGGKPFTFYKFRTMYSDAEERFPELYRYEYSPKEIETICFKIPDDPRLTRFGKHLRKTTLDELPNCINVLKGDMTLIGPRPDIPEMTQYYKPRQRKKFAVKPGVTGPSQVNGRGLLTFKKTLEYDVEYVEKRSWSRDLKIIMKTIKVTILRIGAF